jgi:hypothetical protein
MRGKTEKPMERIGEVRKSDHQGTPKRTERLELSPRELGQSYSGHYPRRAENDPGDPLGEPLKIADVARLLGCSIWTVRQRHLPSGLPYFRIGSAGKLLFYRKQVVEWILENQRARRR